MDIRPIFTALRRHKTAAALIVIEVALSCAIICNALFLINGRLERMDRVSGLAEKEIVRVQLAGIGRDENAEALTKADLAALRALPGVKAASVTNQVAFNNSSWNSGVRLNQQQTHQNLNATVYMADDQFLDTLGLNLVAGRKFNSDEFLEWETLNKPDTPGTIPAAIITRSMANALYPDGSALGKTFYSWGDEPIKIIGIVEHLVRPSEQGGPTAYEYSMMFPIRVPFNMGGHFLIRTDPERRAEVLKAAVDVLQKNSPNRIILEQDTIEEMRNDFYRQDRSMAWLLVAVCVALLIVTALGIVGLASFWVQQRSKQIGVRRALGATRRQILRYFQTENFLLASLGIVIGMALAYGINQVLMGKYELARLPLYYLPVGAVLLWLLGQISVLGPAMRAASVPPAVATRSA
ncbi:MULTISPECIES: FtsX-like permease family protein [unclassified Pseudoxanthomonas]|uniref:ABC transporter permease n=1 Tax=unclassified Pseudoxanthomonas TaxID=2645906 RepID=UPI00160C2CB2|nr:MULTISPECIES: FtsX-like permease family protein [unclassified Pseudoxanthomonas]MBB3276675.1 putative ABC transport system permease protein [Pseudoxanthomonas sp. OG2]MBV7472251.1 FtsX-like permease family protein [Pseudoxanthomonas sp. PXM05]